MIETTWPHPTPIEAIVTDECRCPVCVPPIQAISDEPRPNRTIIALTGLAGSGKSTVAQHLVREHGYTRVRFAGPLKAMMAALGMTPNQIEGSEKEKPCALLSVENWPKLLARVPHAFAAIGIDDDSDTDMLCGRTFRVAKALFVYVLAQIVARGGLEGATPRLGMQYVGTEFGRDLIGRDFWINLWRAALPLTGNIVVDDCRFPNEAEAVLEAGGVLVKVERPGAGSGAAGHSSEGQELGPVAATIRNTASIGDLLARVDQWVRYDSAVTTGGLPNAWT